MKKIIIDCDPGHDDMLAMILALSRSEDLKVLGITTVAGNQTGEKTYTNALKVLNLIGRQDVPVSRGFDKPLVREQVIAPQIHGVSGLDGAQLPEPKGLETKKHAVDFIIDTILRENEKIYLVPTGPLTNIAVALLKEPKIKEKLEKIKQLGINMNVEPVWWSLALGACLGGNGTIIGASANVAVADISNSNGYKISFIDFMKYGMLIMIMSLAISTVYLWLLYFL